MALNDEQCFAGVAKTELVTSLNNTIAACHGMARAAGWWKDQDGKPRLQDIQKDIAWPLLLIISEVIEGAEGVRKDKMDDKLTHRKMLEVELADAVIRIMDLAGGIDIDLAGAVAEKLEYNSQREDHKPENRYAEGGKRF